MIPRTSLPRSRLLALGGFAAAVLGLAPLAAQAQPTQIDWQVDAREASTGQVELTLAYRREHDSSVNGRNVSLSDLQGLSASQLNGTESRPVSFRLARDAGTFACQGSAQRTHASGECRFEPSGSFAQLLRSRGAGEAQPDQLLDLAMEDVGVPLLDELRRERYAQPDVAELVKVGQHGVSLTWLQGMDAAGYRLGHVEDLIRLRDHGITPRYVGELRAAGYHGLSADELVHLRDHGVSANYLKTLADMGYSGLPAAEVAQMRDHGVSESFLRELDQAGYRRLPAEQVIRLRDHGVTVGFIQKVNSTGGRMDPDALIRLRDRGGR